MGYTDVVTRFVPSYDHPITLKTQNRRVAGLSTASRVGELQENTVRLHPQDRKHQSK